MRRSLPRPSLLRFAALLLLLPGCVSLIEPSAAHVSWADERWPGTTLEDLQAARALFLETCTECHAPKSPTRYEPGEWEFAINRMLEGEAVEIEPAVISTVARYLSVASALPNDKAVAARQASRAGAPGAPAPPPTDSDE